jgi:hypothetical protein
MQQCASLPRFVRGHLSLAVPSSECYFGASNGESAFHIELVAAVGVDVLPDQRRDCSEVGRGHPCLPFGRAQDALHHERVDVDHAILKQMKAEHAGLVILMPVAGELAALREKDEVVSAVPLLDNVEAFVNLAA